MTTGERQYVVNRSVFGAFIASTHGLPFAHLQWESLVELRMPVLKGEATIDKYNGRLQDISIMDGVVCMFIDDTTKQIVCRALELSVAWKALDRFRNYTSGKPIEVGDTCVIPSCYVDQFGCTWYIY